MNTKFSHIFKLTLALLLFLLLGQVSAQTYDFNSATCAAAPFNNLTNANFNSCLGPNVISVGSSLLDVSTPSNDFTSNYITLDFGQGLQAVAFKSSSPFINGGSYKVTFKVKSFANATLASANLSIGNNSSSTTGLTSVGTVSTSSNVITTSTVDFTVPATGTFNYFYIQVINYALLVDDVVISDRICAAGSTAPALSATTITNVCPATTVSLPTTSTGPGGTTVKWFTNNAHTGTAVADPSQVPAGIYYAFYYDATNSCYSPASAAVTATVTACCPTAAPPVN